MIPVDQTTFGDGSDGREPGNCFAACVASLLELEIGEVPNFSHVDALVTASPDPTRDWFRRANAWLSGRGMAFVEFGEEGGAPAWLFDLPFVQPGQLWIGTGPADRDGRKMNHAVIMRGPEKALVHDPNPRYGRTGIERVDAVGYVVPLDPAQICAPWTDEVAAVLAGAAECPARPLTPQELLTERADRLCRLAAMNAPTSIVAGAAWHIVWTQLGGRAAGLRWVLRQCASAVKIEAWWWWRRSLCAVGRHVEVLGPGSGCSCGRVVIADLPEVEP